MSIDEKVYLDKPAEWTRLAKRLRAAGVFGLDSEFYGLDVRKQSCVGRAICHVWSVAVRTERKSALGFRRARGWVLPAAALSHPALKAVLEDRGVTKYVHNQPVDDHTLHNHGVALAGCVNTLDWARWTWPELVTEGGFGLKSLMQVKLHRNPVCEYLDVVRDERNEDVTVTKRVWKSVCDCGVAKCRKRKGHLKQKQQEMVTSVVEKRVKFQYPLESILPGHSRWELLVKYAAEDAVAALELAELMENAPEEPSMWPYGGKRPGYNQGVADQVVLMERTGFRIDTEWAGKQATRAEADELRALTWLRRWYRANVESDDEDSAVDRVWASPKQLGELFALLGFPRSPIWKKGRVKQWETKMDAAALEWISRNCPASKQLVGKLLHLKKIRAGKKYLLAMRDCGGWVNPIAGSGSDTDDRFGAVTGRLAIKGVLAAQQLPANEELDLYQIRRGVIA